MAEQGPAARAGTARPTLLWLADARLPDEPAVRRFRAAVTAHLAAHADVTRRQWQPPSPRVAPDDDAAEPAAGPAAAEPAAAEPVAAEPVAAGTTPAGGAAALLAEAGEADVVVCETPAVAHQVVAAGAPRDRTWAYVLPPFVPAPGEPFRLGLPLLRSGHRLRGLLTDTAAAREAIERAFEAHPVDVLVLPPVPPPGARGPDLAPRLPQPRTGPAEPADGEGPPRDVRETLDRMRGWAAPPGDAAARARPDPAGQQGWPDLITDAEPPGPSAAPLLRGPHADAGPGDAAQADDVAGALPRLTPRRPLPDAPVVGVFGFDLRFFRPLGQRLREGGEIDLRTDEWPGPAERTPGSLTLARRADVLVAEWARPNAAWLSARKRDGQFLVVRLHRFEVQSRYPAEIDVDRVDAVVHVGPDMGREIEQRLGWPRSKLVYIPNLVDLPRYDRPKHPGARFGLGVVGAVPSRKRLDLALDLLREIRSQDPRFVLCVRTGLPWQNRYLRDQPAETDVWRRCARRIEQDPLLRGAVRIDPPGADMARWYRGVGHVLSLSDAESFHAVLAEGMASGAVPVLRGWQGAEHLWHPRWVRTSVPDAAGWVLDSADRQVWAERSRLARTEVAASYPPDRVVAAWRDLLGRDPAAAARHFPDPLR